MSLSRSGRCGRCGGPPAAGPAGGLPAFKLVDREPGPAPRACWADREAVGVAAASADHWHCRAGHRGAAEVGRRARLSPAGSTRIAAGGPPARAPPARAGPSLTRDWHAGWPGPGSSSLRPRRSTQATSPASRLSRRCRRNRVSEPSTPTRTRGWRHRDRHGGRKLTEAARKHWQSRWPGRE